MKRLDAGLPTIAVLLSILHAACVGACDIVSNSRKIVAGYELEEVSGAYYLQRCGRPPAVCEVERIGSSDIEQIGWNASRIVFHTSEAHDAPGWMIVDVQTNDVSGPFSDAELRTMRRERVEFRQLAVYEIKDAWLLLK